jgi:hypothetical protein
MVVAGDEALNMRLITGFMQGATLFGHSYASDGGDDDDDEDNDVNNAN